MSFELTSPAFTQGSPIPAKYTCTGENVSPELKWANLPTGTQSLALILDDPDAPGGTFTHWVMYNLPAIQAGLKEDVQPLERFSDGSLSGKNSAGKLGYTGPCPPSGTHRYFFKLYALDGKVALASGATAGQLVQAIQGHVLAETELMGTYRK